MIPHRSHALLVAGLIAGCFTLFVCMGCGGWNAADGLAASVVVSSATDYDLPPDGVVREQMAALAEWGDDPHAVGRVFSFASPGNRVVTGPVDNFAGLVESEPYLPLTNNQGYAVGRAVESGDAATVLVTLIDRAGALVAYRFYLSRQASEPQRRWMTDAVYRFTPNEAGAVDPMTPTI